MGKRKSNKSKGKGADQTREEFVRTCLEDPGMIETLTAKELGRLGEALASLYLEDRGYVLDCQGYRCPEGEADLIMLDPATEEVVLIEVKTRRDYTDDACLYPELAVDERKQRRYGRIAARYIMENFPVFSIRFDVVAVTVRPGGCAAIEHLVSAFSWDSDR